MRQLMRAFHAALVRPFRRPDVDLGAREQIERRHREIAARIADYRQIEAMARLRRRAAGKHEGPAGGER